MIELLNKRVDSLNQIVRTERQYIARLKTQLEEQRVKKDHLNKQLDQQKVQIDDLNDLNNKLSSDVERLDAYKSSLIVNATEKEYNYEKTLKLKQDSLTLVVTELKKQKLVPPINKTVVKQSNPAPIKLVTIGTQVWMSENLNVAVFRNGVAIREAKTKEQWIKAGENGQAAWCYYNNDPKNGAKYGRLYNWYALVDDNGLCPTGLHVPTDSEWTVLTDYLGGENVAGGKMKEVGTTSWNGPNTDATNTSLFSGLPGGDRYSVGSDSGGRVGNWWSSTEYSIYDAWYRSLGNNDGSVFRSTNLKDVGLSVRCLQD
jgi:uncharacterized protein (TIGR02145 family)